MNEQQPSTRTLSKNLGSHDTRRSKHASGRWRGVFFEGPEPDQDPEGDEIPVWFVLFGDEQAEPLGKVYRSHSFKLAENLAHRIAGDRKLELIQEAMPA
jgi:hypothetical protein